MMFEGEIKQIIMRGIERAGADSICTDGSMNEVIGLVHKDGSYVPYDTEHEDVSVPANTILVRIHHTSTQDNDIAVTSDLKMYWRKRGNDGDFSYIGTLPNAEVAFLSNTICTCQSDVYYLWQGDNYFETHIDNLPKIELRSGMWWNYDHNSRAAVGPDSSFWGKELSLQYNAVKKIIEEMGRLVDMHMCCYAYRTTSGEYCYVSKPFLILNPNPEATIKRNDTGWYGMQLPYFYMNTQGGNHVMMTGNELQYKVLSNLNDKNIQSVRLFMTAGHGLYDDEVSKNSYATPTDEHIALVIKELRNDDIFREVYSIEATEIRKMIGWKSVELQNSSKDFLGNLTPLETVDLSSYFSDGLYVHNSRLHTMNSTRTPYDKYDINSFFYNTDESLVMRNSIPDPISEYGDVKSVCVSNYVKEVKKNFVSQESAVSGVDLGNRIYSRMEDFSRDGEINLTVTYNDNSTKTITHTLLDGEHYSYRDIIDEIGRVSNSTTGRYRIVVLYDDVAGAEKYITVSEGAFRKMYLQRLNPLICVNDINATKIILYLELNTGSGGIKYYRAEYSLDRSIFSNTSWFVLQGCKPDFMPDDDLGPDEYRTIEAKNPIASYSLRVSEPNKPSSFELADYPVSKTKLIGIGYFSPTLSVDNYGKHPITCFAEDGIYSLAIKESGEFAYGNITKMSEYKCLHRNTICEINNAIIFATETGLKILSSNGIDNIFDTLLGDVNNRPMTDRSSGSGMLLYHSIVTNSQVVDMLDALSVDDFRELLYDTDTHVTFDRRSERVIVFNKSLSHIFVVDLMAKLVTKLDKQITMFNGEEEYYE